VIAGAARRRARAGPRRAGRARGSIAGMAALLLALIASAPGAARADRVGAGELEHQASEALDALRYDEALALLDRAWRQGDSGPARLRRIFALAGRAAGSMGDEAAARLWFSRWLCLDPDAALPAGTSPKLTSLFGEARAGLAGASISARARRRGRSIEVTVERDPLAMIAAARAGAARADVVAGGARLTASEAGAEAPAQIELIDRHGNVLAAIAVEPAAGVDRPPPAAASGASWYERPLPWAVTAGGLAAAGGVALGVAVAARSDLRALNASSAAHEFSEARALERRFDRAQWAARIAFGGAAVAAAVGAVCYVRLRGARVSAAPADGAPGMSGVTGVIVVWTGSLP
jgi:hypothetical protein